MWSIALLITLGILYWCFIQPWTAAWEREEQQRLIHSGIHEIDQMDGHTFERHLALLFQRLGYVVEQTKASGDFGADLLVAHPNGRVVVQVKRSAKNVGPKAVQEVVAAKAYYKCPWAIVVTNQGYTQSAKELAKANAVELWDRDRLVTAILASQDETTLPTPAKLHPLEVTLVRVGLIILAVIVLWALIKHSA